MIHSRRFWVCVLVVAASWDLFGCRPTKSDGLASSQVYTLTLDRSIGFSVDYRTGTIAPALKNPQVELGFLTKDGRTVLSVDGSRLGGGEIAGKFQAYLDGTEVEKGEFQCLYQHTRDIAVDRKADSVKIIELKFTRVIE